MRAVNLMPGDARGHGPSSSTALGTYILLGGLAALVVFVTMWTLTGKQIDDRGAKLERVTAEAQAAEARAAAAQPYADFAQLAASRKATVASLSATRFDWSHALREISRVVPSDVWLIAATGTSGAAAGVPGPTTSAAPAPRFELQGCTTSQANVARLMARLRAIDGVRTVDLTSSTKPDSVGDDHCPANATRHPIFTIVVSFGVPGAPAPKVDSTGQLATASAPAAAAGEPAGEPADDTSESSTKVPVNDSTKAGQG